MAVLYFDEAWDEGRIQWEIDRLKAEMSSYKAHIERLESLAEKKREAKALRAG
ncbi:MULTISPECIES: hypothetical protein [Geobacter]|uniref:Uncharacterized protein n=1 Tax=Geobacter anodireducens TaxID=1340425 RepID=A0ABR9NSJ7_9BACT|nr:MULTISPECIES: hypothetical protein [Geobacter]MBE2887237.1 hypothetical protein [Geobacter anodireducens]